MPVQHVNRKGQTFYLHQKATKKANLKYFFSMKRDGELVESVPEGFEIYENPNGQVFLRKIQPKMITDDEIAVVEKGVRELARLQYYRADVKKNVISVFVPNQDVGRLSEIFPFSLNSREAQGVLAQAITYSAMLRFVLVDDAKRIFVTQRYCFRGSIDDWIDIGGSDTLSNLVKRYVKHLGRDSYFELF